jgi:multidrug efflux pump subunit AcrA (membrane-fusion protein)
MTPAHRSTPRWLNVALGTGAATLVAVGILLVGPPSQSATVQSRIVTVQQGVVQSTVSGTGNIQPVTQLDLGFKTSGVVQHIYITQGQHVTPGQLLAELDPQSAEAALEQSRASLRAAQAALVQEEEDGGEASSGQSVGDSGTSGRMGASTAAATTPGGSGSTAAEKPQQSAATREANLASARAAVRSDGLTVRSDEQAVADTKLFSPQSGTIVSLSGEVGETVSGTGTSRASTATGSSSAAGTGAASGGAGGASAAAGRSASSSAASSASSTSSSSFAVLSDLSSMQLVVGLSESEIVHVHVGQPATATVEALAGRKLAAHVASVAMLSTDNSGVVSYDVTFQLDQLTSGLKPGMSASAEVVVRQEEGVNVPTSAISGSAVTVVQNGGQARRRVVTGLAGDSSTIVLSGLKAGEQITLPIASSAGSTSVLSRLRGRAGGLGGGGPFVGAGFGAGPAGLGRGGG